MCIRAACHSCVSGTSRRSPGQRNATLRRGYGQGDVTTERALYGCWSLQDGQCLHCVWTAAQLTAGGARSRRAAGYNRAAAACTGAGIRKWAICELAPALSPCLAISRRAGAASFGCRRRRPLHGVHVLGFAPRALSFEQRCAAGRPLLRLRRRGEGGARRETARRHCTPPCSAVPPGVQLLTGAARRPTAPPQPLVRPNGVRVAHHRRRSPPAAIGGRVRPGAVGRAISVSQTPSGYPRGATRGFLPSLRRPAPACRKVRGAERREATVKTGVGHGGGTEGGGTSAERERERERERE